MMFEEVMIQKGVQLNLCTASKKFRGGWGGGGGGPPMMFEEVMIQKGVHFFFVQTLKVAGGWGVGGGSPKPPRLSKK